MDHSAHAMGISDYRANYSLHFPIQRNSLLFFLLGLTCAARAGSTFAPSVSLLPKLALIQLSGSSNSCSCHRLRLQAHLTDTFPDTLPSCRLQASPSITTYRHSLSTINAHTASVYYTKHTNKELEYSEALNFL